jgi:short subunit dehydrogenase-like uncharacterized protein
MLCVCFAGGLLKLLAGFRWGRGLLLRYPRLFSLGAFSHEGPTAKQLAGASFTFDMFASAYTSTAVAGAGAKPSLTVKVQVSGPEPGYVATPILVVQAALTLLEERAAVLGANKGGVFTPGAAFINTGLIQRLQAAGVSFREIV